MYCLMVAYLGGCIEVKDIRNQYAIPNAETLLDINDLYRKMQKVLSTIQELEMHWGTHQSQSLPVLWDGYLKNCNVVFAVGRVSLNIAKIVILSHIALYWRMIKNIDIVVLKCQKCNECLNVHKSLGLLFGAILKMSLPLSLSLYLHLLSSFCWSGHVSSLW